MTLMKSLLLGSAAGIVGIASAQAADLPTRKGAPAVEYVRICSISVNGTPVVGWMLPGSDTCFKLTGYVTAQIGGGNIKDGQLLCYSIRHTHSSRHAADDADQGRARVGSERSSRVRLEHPA